MCSLTVLEATTPNAGCPLKAQEESPSGPLPAVLALAHLGRVASLCLHVTFSSRVSNLSLLVSSKDACHWIQGPPG